MNYTTMFAVPESGEIFEVAEFGDARGWAMRIWNAVAREYLIPKELSGMEMDLAVGKLFLSGELKPLWNLGSNGRLPRDERLVLCSTYDKVIVESAMAQELADAYRTFDARFPVESVVNHLPAIADQLCESIPQGVVGYCWRQTSIECDIWIVGERAFDLSRDTDYESWFLFEEFEAESVTVQ